MSKFARAQKSLDNVNGNHQPRFSGPAAPLSPNASVTKSTSNSTVDAAARMAMLAAELRHLSSLLKTAAEELPAASIKNLAGEIQNDWKVENMSVFIEGFLKGAGVEVSKADV
ncbi:hypothetical protein RUND412_005207 [Rhizina undulata]